MTFYIVIALISITSIVLIITNSKSKQRHDIVPLNLLQKCRLYIETHPPYFVLYFGLLLWGLILSGIFLNIPLLIILIAPLAILEVSLFITIDKLTDKWWKDINDHNLNSWDRERQK